MSIFDEGFGGLNPMPWIKEKALAALHDAARFVDLANEPDTTTWYARRLRELATPLVGHVAPLVALLYGAGSEAASHETWGPILKGGTFALARWCKAYGIADPAKGSFDALARDRDDEDIEEKATPAKTGVVDIEDEHALDLRCEVHSAMARVMLHAELSEPARRLLCWFLFHLGLSPFADAVVVSKRFLPTDIGCSPEDVAQGYRELYERGLVERLDDLPGLGVDALALRLVAEGRNDTKHPAPHRDETFGFPGARIGGEPTLGNEIRVRMSEPLAKAAARWLSDPAELALLRDELQRKIGEDRVFIEGVVLGDPSASRGLLVRLRCRMTENDTRLAEDLGTAADAWIRARLVRANPAASD